MGIVRGTLLAASGIGGWLVEQQLYIIGSALESVVGGVALPPEVSWGLGCTVGIVAGDIFTALVGEDVSLGRRAGILKGLIASGVGIGSLYADGGIVFFVVSIWLSTVASDLLGL